MKTLPTLVGNIRANNKLQFSMICVENDLYVYPQGNGHESNRIVKGYNQASLDKAVGEFLRAGFTIA